jgi:starch synthase (maltosyl-transferring)
MEIAMKALQSDGRNRVIIEGIVPEIDGGRFPAKRTVGDQVRVEADIFTDGHDSISAALLVRHESSETWDSLPLAPLVNDRWHAEFHVAKMGRYHYKIHGWVDQFETWRRDLLKRIQADSDTNVDYLIGADLIDQAADRGPGKDATWLREQASRLRADKDAERLRATAIDPALQKLVAKYPDTNYVTESDHELQIVVDPVRARFSSWYELFPRSTAPESGRHGTLKDCEKRLPYIADMGFDVVYLPPIHPIGVTFRKGPNNAPTSGPGDYGSPWAIGSVEGGHKSVHPLLGTIEDFTGFVVSARSFGISVALDIAFQVSPDHPYVKEHEEWFRKRPDGTIQYAENPPKKYQDIYPFDFETPNWIELWNELKSVFLFWIDKGVTIFRVDNPHTKAFPFWEWVINEIKREVPEVLFLAEAFTRPKIMYRLAKLGFSQSYTYFPWRNAKNELATYLTELAQTQVREFFRPNQWPNTPDILTEFLQIGTRSAFMIRLLLAATLGANYGIYGPAFELLESRPRHHGSEEYLDSEKYEVRHWDLERVDSLRNLIARVNRIRHENTALQSDWGLKFHSTDGDQLLCYSKESADSSSLLVMVVNLDPHYTHSGFVTLPLEQFEIAQDRPYEVEDLLTGARYLWSGPRNYVELNPNVLPAHILKLKRRLKVETDFEYFL